MRKDLRAGQMSILLETAHDLEKMRLEGFAPSISLLLIPCLISHFLFLSVGHFNNLVDLEVEYASHRRRITDGFEELAKTGQDISFCLTETIQEHNRNSLSRKFKNTLFVSSLPAIILNPKLVY